MLTCLFAENIVEGKALIEKELKSFGKAYTDAQKNEIITNVSNRIGMASVDDFYNSLGYGGLSISKVSGKLHDEFVRIVMPEGEEKLPEMPTVPSRETVKKQSHNLHQSVIVDGIDNCLIKLSRCCAPIPGDEIIGFITRGHGVSVHKRDCTNVPVDITACEEPNRWLSARWQSGTESKEFKASLAIECESRVAMMADVANVLADMRVMINAINTRDTKDGNAIIYITITVKSTDFLNIVISKLKGISGVENVTRSKS